MTNDVADPSTAVAHIKAQLAKTSASGKRRAVEKFILTALSCIPWVGGFISAAASLKVEERGLKKDALQSQWLEVHERKMESLGETLGEISDRFDNLGDEIGERIESEQYLSIVRQAFRTWDRAETEEKRKYVANLITNAAGSRICSDDVVRLFVDWLNLYHEMHFAVIREIFGKPGITRYEIWTNLYGDVVRDDSAEADLYRCIIRDLSMGGVIRIARETDYAGHFLRKQRQPRKGAAPTTMESAFEDTKPYVLTELGKQFVHYTMNEVVERIGEA